MPRRSRIDAPDALHHVICRGIERRRIFRDDADRNRFGEVPLATILRLLLTAYAGSFNRRYRRHGHLFQNRYTSIPCQEDAYLLSLIRYIHLNPLRAKIVITIGELDRYTYAGHGVLMGKVRADWQTVDEVLKLIGKRLTTAFTRSSWTSAISWQPRGEDGTKP